ncbi:hypothetical protein [Zhihengliuella halotolerans]|uniref:hypothetical protein n=1 Tax=Zhihengliuella halotolerans TaxID=370736 RepID=UPI0011AF0544|nr:hypothetical protein [Zhihengliuella halotolerans]
MTTDNALTPTSTPSAPAHSARVPRPVSPTRQRRESRLLNVLRAVGRYFRVNWIRAAAQESEYLRLREENLRKYWEASGGRM